MKNLIFNLIFRFIDPLTSKIYLYFYPKSYINHSFEQNLILNNNQKRNTSFYLKNFLDLPKTKSRVFLVHFELKSAFKQNFSKSKTNNKNLNIFNHKSKFLKDFDQN